MKTLKLAIVTFICLTTAIFSNAKAAKVEDTPLSQYHAINTYISATTKGNLNDIEQVIDNSAKFSILRGKQIQSYDKKDMMTFLQENKHLEQGCTVSTSIVNSNADVAVVKVDMKYDTFVRSNYVTLANTGKGWKITDVYSVFK